MVSRNPTAGLGHPPQRQGMHHAQGLAGTIRTELWTGARIWLIGLLCGILLMLALALALGSGHGPRPTPPQTIPVEHTAPDNRLLDPIPIRWDTA